MNRRASSWLRVVPACLAAGLVGCDRSQPVEPAIQAAATGAGGPTVKAPSNTDVVVWTTGSQITVYWQDNSGNEAGFEIWRSPTELEGTFAKLAATGPNVTRYDDVALKPLTQYCYKVRAVKNYDGKTTYSSFSNAACATTPAFPPPNAPSATNAVPSSSSTVDVTWTDNSLAEDGFRVERSLDLGSTWATALTVGANVRFFRDDGRTTDQRVCYRVFAFNGAGDSPPSNTDCTAPPAAPTGLAATGLDGPAIDLAWTDNSAVEDGYELRRSTDGVTFGALTNVPSNSTTYRDGRVSENTTYWYVVRAKKDGAFSDPSGVASARAGVLTPPAAPSLYQPEGYYLGTIWLVWADNSNNEDGFKVERCQQVTCGDADFTLIGTTGANVWWYQDVVGFGIYTYRVRATNRAGDSAPSNQASGRACIEGVDPESPCYP